MAKNRKIRRIFFPLALVVLGGLALWQHFAHLLDAGLEAGGGRALEAQVTVSGSRLNPLKPSYGVEFVSAKIQSDDAAFFSATNLECHTSWGKLLGDSLTVESVQIKELAFDVVSKNGRWNIEGLGGTGYSSQQDSSGSTAWRLERLEIGKVELRVHVGAHVSVHALQDLVFMDLGSSREGFSVEELTRIVVGLVFDQLARLIGGLLPQEVLSAAALDLLPQSLEYELTSQKEELERKLDRELDRIQRDLGRIPGKLGGDLDRLMPLLPRKD